MKKEKEKEKEKEEKLREERLTLAQYFRSFCPYYLALLILGP